MWKCFLQEKKWKLPWAKDTIPDRNVSHVELGDKFFMFKKLSCCEFCWSFLILMAIRSGRHLEVAKKANDFLFFSKDALEVQFQLFTLTTNLRIYSITSSYTLTKKFTFKGWTNWWRYKCCQNQFIFPQHIQICIEAIVLMRNGKCLSINKK